MFIPAWLTRILTKKVSDETVFYTEHEFDIAVAKAVNRRLEDSFKSTNVLSMAIETANNNLGTFEKVATWKSLQVSQGKRILISTTLMPIVLKSEK